jgi:hypothetical protein|tara:strand:+ start:1942 stop:2244 length:303 start_codon:yes stop_codon:yes gene_type:complete
MMIFLIIVCILLTACLGIALWYIRRILDLFFEVTTDIQVMHDNLEEFAKHLGNVYEMEMYYGDETLRGLITHSRELVKSIESFKNIFGDEENEEKYEDEA